MRNFFPTLIATLISVATGSANAFGGGGVAAPEGSVYYTTVENVDGSYSWSAPDAVNGVDERIGYTYSDTFTLIGGSGAAAIDIPTKFTFGGTGDATGEVLLNADVGASYSVPMNGPVSFIGGFYSNGIFDIELQVQFNTPFTLLFLNSVTGYAIVDPVPPATECGLPSANSGICELDVYGSYFADVEYEAFDIPRGSSLSALGGLPGPVFEVPEPSELMLLAFGMATLALRSRIRHHRKTVVS